MRYPPCRPGPCPGLQWAPSVWARPNGTFVLYYATPATHPLDCIYKATAARMCGDGARAEHGHVYLPGHQYQPSGPFVDDSTAAFICPTAQGGSIDPSIFVTSKGTPWLLWKSDGDCCNLPTYIYSQQLSPDGLSTVGPPHELIGATQRWEGGLVEAPSMVQSGNVFWMFYSANLWGNPELQHRHRGLPFGHGSLHQAARPGLAHEHEQCQRTGLRRVGVLRQPAGDWSGWCTTASSLDNQGTTPNGASMST